MRKGIAFLGLGLCALAFAVVQAQQRKPKGPTLTPSDYTEIQQLYAHYAYAYDAGAVDEYTHMFTRDGVFIITDGQTFKGTERLTLLARYGPSGLPSSGGSGNTKNKFTLNHFTTNVAIDPSLDGAKGRAYLAVIQVRKGGDRIVRSSGLYEDDLVKTPDGWRFKTRLYTRLPDPDGISTPPQ
jgi:hypothetical protein